MCMYVYRGEGRPALGGGFVWVVQFGVLGLIESSTFVPTDEHARVGPLLLLLLLFTVPVTTTAMSSSSYSYTTPLMASTPWFEIPVWTPSTPVLAHHHHHHHIPLPSPSANASHLLHLQPPASQRPSPSPLHPHPSTAQSTPDAVPASASTSTSRSASVSAVSSPRSMSLSLPTLCCSRCRRENGYASMFQFGKNLYYCSHCARMVGYVG